MNEVLAHFSSLKSFSLLVVFSYNVLYQNIRATHEKKK